MTLSLWTIVLVVANTVTVVFGAVLSALAHQAYRRTHAPALRALAVGIGLLTAGAVLGGVLHQLAAVDIRVAVAVQAVATALGVAVMTYSVYGTATPEEGVAVRARRPE